MNKLIIILILAASVCISCSKNETTELVVITTLEELDDIIEDCRNNEFDTREEIENNIIGEWQLIGIRSGWINEFEKKDITLIIDQESIKLTDRTTGEDSETDWELKFFEVNTYEYYYLETNEPTFNNRLGMETFCKDYMYGTGRVDDGYTYVYAKVD